MIHAVVINQARKKSSELMMIEEGEIRSVVDKIYSFNQIAEAHKRVETEQRIGIVVLSFDNN